MPNSVYIAAALAAFGWLLKYLVESILGGLKGLKDAIEANTEALSNFREEAHETFARKDDYRLKWIEQAYGPRRRSDDDTLPG